MVREMSNETRKIRSNQYQIIRTHFQLITSIRTKNLHIYVPKLGTRIIGSDSVELVRTTRRWDDIEIKENGINGIKRAPWNIQDFSKTRNSRKRKFFEVNLQLSK